MSLKKFEDYTTVNAKDLGNNWSAEFHVNKAQGKKPYIKKDGIYVEIEKGKSIPKNAIYLKPEQVEKLNYIGQEIKKLVNQRRTILINNDVLDKI